MFPFPNGSAAIVIECLSHECILDGERKRWITYLFSSLVFRETSPEKLHKKSFIHNGPDLNHELLDFKLTPYWDETWGSWRRRGVHFACELLWPEGGCGDCILQPYMFLQCDFDTPPIEGCGPCLRFISLGAALCLLGPTLDKADATWLLKLDHTDAIHAHPPYYLGTLALKSSPPGCEKAPISPSGKTICRGHM